jgi:NAD(P)-dependent dehydrogenase (short-subunit alcohol dehydrogenase family)
MTGKWVVITGATSGIGRATALALGRLGANLILVSRNRKKGTALVHGMTGRSRASRVQFIDADLSSLAQVRAAGDRIREQAKIDVLINNAGARFDRYGRTADGGEQTFATNHLGHFLLTGLLLDRLAAAPSARIITVSSSAASQAKIEGGWQVNAENFDRRQAYAKSKLANLLFAFELARRLRGTTISSLAMDPGVVATHFARNNGMLAWLKHLIAHGRKGELLTPAQGADTLIYLASTEELPPNASGMCFHRRQPVVACAAAYDTGALSSLWRESVALTGIDLEAH